MTEVPSPQEELRTAIAAAVYAEYCKLPVDRYPHQDKVAAALLPLFAARVAAIEARRDEVGRMAAEATVRASKAEADLAAMTTKADTYQRMYYAEHGEIARDLSESKLIAATLYDEMQQLQADLTALHSWDGLMSLLDEHWPTDIFPMLPDTDTRDPGPRINSLLRWVDQLRADLTAAQERIAVAEARALGAQRASIDMSVMVTRAAAQIDIVTSYLTGHRDTCNTNPCSACEDHAVLLALLAAEVPATPEEPPQHAEHEFVAQSTPILAALTKIEPWSCNTCGQPKGDPLHQQEPISPPAHACPGTRLCAVCRAQRGGHR